MDASWTPCNADAPRTVTVLRHPSATFADLLSHTATDAVDLTAYVSACKHTSKDADVTLSYHTALSGSSQPQPGELLELQLNGQFLWVGFIDSVSSYRFTTGEHSLSVKAYTRDNTPNFNDVQRITDIYPAGTPLGVIAADAARAAGLTTPEINLPAFGSYTPQSNMQLANIPVASMLTTLLQAAGYEPFVDAHGVLRAISRDLARAPDLVLTADRVVSIDGSKARAPLTCVRIKWLDPQLTLSAQVAQSLFQTTITAGFFQLHQNQDVYFSDDRTQRARNTYLVIKQSANSGLLPVCTEHYAQTSLLEGRIDLQSTYWAPALATAALGALIAASFIPDWVIVAGLFASFGYTVSWGRLLEMGGEVALMFVMMSLGTGVYEVWGEPFDYVYARNTTEALAGNTPSWLAQVDEIETDFVLNEAQAQAFAARELIYQSRAATTYKVSIIDDPRIEPGDIVQLQDGSRLYVTDYARNLAYGAPAVLELTGFQA